MLSKSYRSELPKGHNCVKTTLEVRLEIKQRQENNCKILIRLVWWYCYWCKELPTSKIEETEETMELLKEVFSSNSVLVQLSRSCPIFNGESNKIHWLLFALAIIICPHSSFIKVAYKNIIKQWKQEYPFS